MILQIVYALADKEKKDVANINDELTNMAMNVSALDALVDEEKTDIANLNDELTNMAMNVSTLGTLTNKAILDASAALSAIKVADVSIDKLIAAQAVLSQNLNSLYEISIQMASVISGLNNSLDITNSSTNAAYDSIGLDASLKPDWEGMFEDGTTIVSAIKQGAANPNHHINFYDYQGNFITRGNDIPDKGYITTIEWPVLADASLRLGWPFIDFADFTNIQNDIDIQQLQFNDPTKNVVKINGVMHYVDDDDCYFENSDIETFTNSDSLLYILSSAFSKCPNLTTVEIGDNIKSIGSYILSYNKGIGSFSIPASVETVSSAAFGECYGLKTLNVNCELDYIPESFC